MFVTLRFVAHRGIFNWACSMLAQNGFPFTHVEYIRPALPPSDKYPDGRNACYIGSMGDGGVMARDQYYDVDGFSDAPNFLREMFVDVEVTPDQAAIFEAFLESQVGKPYDYLAVLAFFWPSRDWEEFDHWDCAELIGAALGECGLLPREMAVKFSRLTVLGVYLLVTSRTISTRDDR